MPTSSPLDDAETTPRGGSGGGSAPTKPEIKLFELALREHWPMSAEARSEMIRQLEGVVSEDGMIKKKPRLFLAAAKALAGLSRINLAVVDTAIRANQADDLAEQMARIEEKLDRQGGPPT